jgi:hypothetical protein
MCREFVQCVVDHGSACHECAVQCVVDMQMCHESAKCMVDHGHACHECAICSVSRTAGSHFDFCANIFFIVLLDLQILISSGG